MIFFIIYFLSCVNAQIITEFQSIQSDDEPEWIEIYNDKDEDLILDSFRIADSQTSLLINPIIVKSNTFKVFTKDKILLQNKYNIESEFIVDANFPILNNTTDEIKIYQGETLLDSLYYDMKWFENKYSVERVDFLKPANQDNLKNSFSILGGTPLDYNSNRIYDSDLKVSISEIKNDSVFVEVMNVGRKRINKFDYEVYLDLDRDENFDLMELIYSRIDNQIDSSWSYNHFKYLLMSDFDIYGAFNLLFKINSDIDQNRGNDTITVNANFSPRKGSILINEFMFEPDNNNSEFVEIYSSSNFDININNLYLHDAQNEDGNGKRFDIDYLLKPGDYFVIAADSNIFNTYNNLDESKIYVLNQNLSLNNSGDKIILKWSDGFIIDELEYFTNWHSSELFSTQNISLEKKIKNQISNDKNNWTSSSDTQGATPTYSNSFVNKTDKDFGIKLPKNPFSFVEEEVIKIQYSTPFDNSIINLSLFSKQGAKLGMIKELNFSGSNGEILWDGKLNNKQLRSGTYVLYLESVKKDTQEIYIAKEIIVIVNSN